jgi:hypothetical protein
VTVTVVVADGVLSVFLTKESGRVPLCAQGADCLCNEAGDVLLRRVVPEGYLVVQHSAAWWWTSVQWSEVMIAKLSAESLSVVQRRFVPWLMSCRSRAEPRMEGSGIMDIREWLKLAGVLPSMVETGGFSSGARCGCVVSKVCSACAGGEEQARFVSQQRFCGLCPDGEEHWWKGVTDGVQGEPGGRSWQVCFESWKAAEEESGNKL